MAYIRAPEGIFYDEESLLKITPQDWENVRLKTSGNVIEKMWCEHLNAFCHVRKLSADYYMLLDGPNAGEVREYEHTKNRKDNTQSLRHTFANIRDVINCNITEPEKCKWVTVTYKENMKDPEKLYNDHKAYLQRMHRKYGKFEYIAVAEPQERGAWHIHELLIFREKAPYIPQKEMLEMWRKSGGAGLNVHKVDDGGDNLGAYLTAYLGDVVLPDDKKPPDGSIVKEITLQDGTTKRYIKGGRLHMYPPGFNIYRTSTGIKRPVVEWMKEAEAKKKVKAATLTKEKTFRINDNETGFKNVIYTAYYNTKRGKVNENKPN